MQNYVKGYVRRFGSDVTSIFDSEPRHGPDGVAGGLQASGRMTAVGANTAEIWAIFHFGINPTLA